MRSSSTHRPFCFVDQHRLESRAVAQLDIKPAFRPVLVRAVHDDAGGIEAAERARAGERQERILRHLLLVDLLGVVGQNEPGLRRDGLAQRLDPLLQEKHHRGVVVLATALGPAIEEVADRVDADDVRRCIAEARCDRGRDERDAHVVEQHAQLRRGDEIVARRGITAGSSRMALQALAQIVVLDLGLQIENPQCAWRREAEEGHARGHVDQQADQEVALADLRRAAENQHPARRQHARRDDVLRHRAVVVEQRAERERRDDRDGGRFVAQQGRTVALHMTAPQPSASSFSRSSGQAGRSIAALYWQIASHPSSRLMRPSWTRRM